MFEISKDSEGHHVVVDTTTDVAFRLSNNGQLVSITYGGFEYQKPEGQSVIAFAQAHESILAKVKEQLSLEAPLAGIMGVQSATLTKEHVPRVGV